MSRTFLRRLVISVALALGLHAGVTHSKESRAHERQGNHLRYRYISLADAQLPPGFLFFDPRAITDSGRVIGNAYLQDGETLTPYVATYRNGVVKPLQPGIADVANNRGTAGGSVLIDPENFTTQAALFHDDDVELIPPQPGESFSFVTALSDSGLALVISFDAEFNQSTLVYENGHATKLDFGPSIQFPFFLHINNQGLVSGTVFMPAVDGYRGFRFNPGTGEATILDPLSTEPHAWALDINNSGGVLGYSFVFGEVERIGIWDRHGEFNTYFVEGTPEVPTISNDLRFNDKNLIIITNTSEASGRNSYVVPRRGVRLNLMDLIDDPPPADGFPLWNVLDVNNHGDMIGIGLQTGGFLLQRIGGRRR